MNQWNKVINRSEYQSSNKPQGGQVLSEEAPEREIWKLCSILKLGTLKYCVQSRNQEFVTLRSLQRFNKLLYSGLLSAKYIGTSTSNWSLNDGLTVTAMNTV